VFRWGLWGDKRGTGDQAALIARLWSRQWIAILFYLSAAIVVVLVLVLYNIQRPI